MGTTVLLAFFLALFTGVTIVVIGLGFNMWAPLFYGIVAGIIVGNINLGLQIGAICALMGLGFYTYGGATMPDFSIGAIFGVFMTATQVGGGASLESVRDQVVPIITAIALFMSLFDILGRGSTTVFQHGGDNALAKRNLASFQRWHLAGTIPWVLSRAIPVFIGMLFIDQYQILADKIDSLKWLQRGLGVVGKSLPAVGFALLLSYMDIAAYWPYMIVGFVIYVPLAFLETIVNNLSGAGIVTGVVFPSPIVILAIVGIVAAGFYMKGKKDLAKGGN
jgi:PTS system mannose-specific IIC component